MNDTIPETCPHCHADLTGEPIPENIRASYGATHYTRTIAIYPRERDRTVAWRCPDCGKEWKRE